MENESIEINSDTEQSPKNSLQQTVIKPPKIIKRPGSAIDTMFETDIEKRQMLKKNDELLKFNRELQNKIGRLERQMLEITKRYNVESTKMNEIIYNVETSSQFQTLPLNDINIESIADNNPIDDENEGFIPVLRRQNRKINKNYITKTSKKDPNNKGNINHNDRNSESNKNNNDIKKKTTKIPPINIYVQTPRQTTEVLERAAINNFTIQRVNSNKHVLYMESIESYSKAKDQLNKVYTQYYTYTPKENKPRNIILKGLSNEEDPKEIIMDLKEYDSNELKFLNCLQFDPKNKLKTGENKLPIYLVQISMDSNMNEVYKIKYLRHQRIKWEKVKPQGHITQCRNCQRFGHSAINCNLPYRCVKCDKEHEPQQCKVKKDDGTVAYCSNCREMGHPASFRGCPIYKKITNKIKEAKLIRQQKAQHRTFNSNYVKEGVKYADVCGNSDYIKRGNTLINNNNQNPTSDIYEKILQRLNAFQEYIIENDKK